MAMMAVLRKLSSSSNQAYACRALISSSVLGSSYSYPDPGRTEGGGVAWLLRSPEGAIIRDPMLRDTAHSNLVHLWVHSPLSTPMSRAFYSSEANEEKGGPSEIVEELYQKMLKSLEAQTMPPNASLWSLVNSCQNEEDIKLLFQILQKLRIFRLSNLRILANFNCHLCLTIAEACARTGALDYGIKTLWKHNVYGLTPSIGSAHHLLLYAKDRNDAKLMVKIMSVLRKNSVALQPRTADIVFSICSKANKWTLICEYAKRFNKAGVKLRPAAFDIWMEFAARVGDTKSLWKIEKLRSKSVEHHSLSSGFSCAKGYLLEHNPENAAMAIQLLYQNLPEKTRPRVTEELQKLVSEWPLETIKRQKKDREALANSLKSDIPAMVSSLMTMGLDVKVKLEELKC